MKFSIERMTEVYIKSVNVRAENHGQDLVPAIDIGLRLEGSNNWLRGLDPALKPMLYRPGDPDEEDDQDDDDEQAELNIPDPNTDMPSLRSKAIDMPIVLTREYSGCTLVIDYGMGGKSNIEVPDCTVNGFKVNALQGGTVEIDFRVSAAGLDGPKLGKIGTLVKHDVKVTLTPPSVAGDDPYDLKAKRPRTADATAVPAETPPEAGDIFAAAVTGGDAEAADLDRTEIPRKPGKTASFKARAQVAMKAAEKKAAAKKVAKQKTTA